MSHNIFKDRVQYGCSAIHLCIRYNQHADPERYSQRAVQRNAGELCATGLWQDKLEPECETVASISPLFNLIF